MTLDARTRSSIYHKFVPILGEHDANRFMSEFPSLEADELVTKQFLRAELTQLRAELGAELRAELHAEITGLGAALREELASKEFVRAELGDLRTEFAGALHRQTVWLGGAIAGATALLAALGALT